MNKKRSIGVTVMSVCVLLVSLWGLLRLPHKRLIVSLIFFASSIGILFLKNWARLLIITMSTLLLVFSSLPELFSLIQNNIELGIFSEWWALRDTLLLTLVLTVPYSGLIFFFTRPKVKEQFK